MDNTLSTSRTLTVEALDFLAFVIRQVQWASAPDGRNVCPWCGNFQHQGHKVDCDRQVALGILTCKAEAR